MNDLKVIFQHFLT